LAAELTPGGKVPNVGTQTANLQDIASRFVGTYGGADPDPDVAMLFAPQVSLWHSYDPVEQPPVVLEGSAFAAMLSQSAPMLAEIAADRRNEDVRVLCADDTIVVSWVIRGTLPDGSQLRLPECTVLRLREGLIAQVEMWVESQHLQPIVDAHTARAQSGSSDGE
jgi:ketosteroid isomerase-like protein